MLAAPPSRSTVELPRGVVVGLGGALVVALLALAFLLGRQTAAPAPEPAVADAEPAPPAADPVEPGPLAAPEAFPAAPPTPEPEPTLAAQLELAPEAPGPPARATVTAEPDERAAVASYFAQIAQVEAAVRTWGDPQQLAMQLVQQATQGNRRGLDELAATARQARETLRGVTAPPACLEHHAESLALLDAAVDLLTRLGPALAAQDFTALQALTDQGQALETRTKRLQAIEADLRSRYGLPAAAR